MTAATPQLELAYLFEAHFADGSFISQTPEDRSTIEPEKRSAFYDVAQRIDEVVAFGLYNSEHTYAVDLTDGHFEIDGVAFKAQPITLQVEEGTRTMPPGGRFRLFYCRDREHDVVFGSDGSRTMGDLRCAYRMGWEYTVGDKTCRQTIVII